MNLIEAYKKAKHGEYIKITDSQVQFMKHKFTELNKVIENEISETGLLSDNWQIEHKPLVWEGEVSLLNHAELYTFLDILFHEKEVTKIRIEEIPDES